MINKLIHNIINKFNAINLMCGTLALEMESGGAKAPGAPRLEERLHDLLNSVESDLAKARQMHEEIEGLVAGELDCYKENEHFFKVTKPGTQAIEDKAGMIKQAIAAAAGGEKPLSADSRIIILLHGIEEKALACGIIFKELRASLIGAGKYNTEDE